MEPSVNAQKIRAMKKCRRASLAYNLALYSLTSIITCFVFSFPFWLPSITSRFFLSSFPDLISSCFNAKCLFVLGNLIVIILVGESKLKLSSSSSTATTVDMYDEYVARSRRSYHKDMVDGYVETVCVEEKNGHCEEKKKNLEIRITSMPRGGEERKKGIRSCKSEVWGEGGMVKMERTKSKREERLLEGEKINLGMRSENETAKMEKAKGKKEDQWCKNTVRQEEKKVGIRSSRSAVWGESKIADHEREKGEVTKREEPHEEKMQMGMRSCRSEIWSESEIVRLGNTHKEEEQQLNVLNKRVEDFIARVNKQRLLEAKRVDHIHLQRL